MLRGLVAGFGSSPQSRDFVCVCVCSFELIRVLFTSGGGQVDGSFSKFPFILSSALLIYYLGHTLTTKTCSSLHRRSIKRCWLSLEIVRHCSPGAPYFSLR